MHFPVNPTFLIFKANDANGIPNLVTRMSIWFKWYSSFYDCELYAIYQLMLNTNVQSGLILAWFCLCALNTGCNVN